MEQGFVCQGTFCRLRAIAEQDHPPPIGQSGRRGEAQKLIDELKEQAKHRHVTPYWIAMIYVGLGEKDQAFAWFEKAYEERSFQLLWFKTDPMLDTLRSDPRFADLLRRIGLPQ